MIRVRILWWGKLQYHEKGEIVRGTYESSPTDLKREKSSSGQHFRDAEHISSAAAQAEGQLKTHRSTYKGRTTHYALASVAITSLLRLSAAAP